MLTTLPRCRPPQQGILLESIEKLKEKGFDPDKLTAQTALWGAVYSQSELAKKVEQKRMKEMEDGVKKITEELKTT